MRDQTWTQPQAKEWMQMTQALKQPEMQQEEQWQGRIQCDGCSARAQIVVSLPYGDLAFCLHHYNKNTQALTEQGGVAKLLLSEQIGTSDEPE